MLTHLILGLLPCQTKLYKWIIDSYQAEIKLEGQPPKLEIRELCSERVLRDID